MHWLLVSLLTGTPLSADPPPWPASVTKSNALVTVYSGEEFYGGPTWDPRTHCLYFTAFGSSSYQLLRMDETGEVRVWLDRTEGINGTHMSNTGELLATQAYGHRVMLYGIGQRGPTHIRTLLLDPTLHQPNDICQTARGDIYFTDPDFKGRKTSAVYRISPAGALTRVITDMVVPNGIVASPNGKKLYVADSHDKLWKVYPILRNGALGEGTVFFDPDFEAKGDPDGLTIDVEGNLYATGMGGVWVINEKGTLLGFIPVPEFCSNLTFGGRDGKTLFFTCSKKVYSLEMTVQGGMFGKRMWQIFKSAE